MFDIIPDYLYRTFYVSLMGILVVYQVIRLQDYSNQKLLCRIPDRSALIMAIILTVFLIIFFGTRNPHADINIFQDTRGYTLRFESIQELGSASIWYNILLNGGDPLWGYILIFFAEYGFDVTVWFTFVAACYILFRFIGLYKLFSGQILLAILFAYLNFGFYSGGTNGIRNATALSFIFLSLVLMLKQKPKLIIVIPLFIIGYFVHASVILPTLCILLAKYIIKKPTWGITIWLFSIAISLVAGTSVYSFFEGFGFDDKLDGYLDDDYLNPTSQWGFRWDFLLFSALPIVWGWWVICKKNIIDRTYNIIFNTYALANSMWIIVIRASYSNRFAALSWFIYFLVLLYPLLKFDLVPNQSKLTGYVLLGMYLMTIIL